MSHHRPADHRRVPARPHTWCAAPVAGACPTCSHPACDLLGHLLAHLLSWKNGWPRFQVKVMIDRRKDSGTPAAKRAGKTFCRSSRWQQVNAHRRSLRAPGARHVPRVHFFVARNPHGVAMLRNIC
ncbi:MAG: hypothetical protein WC804_12240 [Sphingomonas sp.]|jgi:hypothetical protein|uniref:hypothetical protein n=1 Tax=Sphingomonas sp. TaxID=28214 RepID=UPI003565C33D